MKTYLKNVNLDAITSNDIVNIAVCVGCNYPQPIPDINKFWHEYGDGKMNKFLEEQQRIKMDYGIKFRMYLHDVIQWLYDHDYLEDRDDSEDNSIYTDTVGNV